MWKMLMSLILTAALFLPIPARARDNRDEPEVQFWSEVGLRYKVLPELRIGVSQHLRSDQGFSRVGGALSDVQVDYYPGKLLRLGAGYRLESEWDRDGDSERSHRLHADTRLRWRFQSIAPDYRLRLQESIRSGENRHTLRNRARLTLTPWAWGRPFLSAELFHRYGDDKGFRVRKWRATIGVSRDVQQHSFDVFYRCDLPWEEKEDPVLHIIGIAYAFELVSPRR